MVKLVGVGDDVLFNMLRMTRTGLTAPDSHGLVDDVTATYTGNQLHTLRDDAPEVLLEASLDVAAGSYSADAFDYDANGNLCRDMSRNITSMEYNGLNLPQRATVAGGAHIDWLYTATGQKLRQTVVSAAGDTISRRDYVGPYLFTDRQFDRYLTAEGYITPDSVYHAYLPDYQGNIVGVVNTAARHMDQYTEYYPYGLPFASSVLPDNNRYKFGAKELIPDLGFNASDFEARTLTHAFPAFSQPDPLAFLAHDLTPYRYGFCNPVNFTDPHGLFETLEEAWRASTWFDLAPIQQDKESHEWFICLDKNGKDPYRSGPELFRYFGNSWSSPFTFIYSLLYKTGTTSQYFVGAAVSYLQNTQYSKDFNIWRGKNLKIYSGLSGRGPNQYTGPRSLAKLKMNLLKGVSGLFTAASVKITKNEYLKDIRLEINAGPNMQRYLRNKYYRDQFFNLVSLSGIWGTATSFGYNLGYQIEAFGQWITNNPNFRIRLNPITLDFTPIEESLREFDEQGFYVY